MGFVTVSFVTDWEVVNCGTANHFFFCHIQADTCSFNHPTDHTPLVLLINTASSVPDAPFAPCEVQSGNILEKVATDTL